MPENTSKFFSDLIKKIDYIQIGIFVIILVVGLIVRKIVMKIAGAFFKVIDKNTKTALFEKYFKPILTPIGNFALILIFYIAFNIIQTGLSETGKDYLVKSLGILLIINVGWFLLGLINLLTLYLENIAAKTDSKLDDQLVPILKKFMRVTIFIIIILLILQNIGYSISGILAGLGLGGFAIAFASKDALSNIFGSIMIFLDRPFQIGDWVKTKGTEGIVEEVGLRSTKIRTFSKTLITIPNNEIANTVIENVSRMPKRRVSFVLGISYGTPAEKVRQAVKAIREILKTDPAVDQEFFLVNFTDFGASSLDLLVYYFTNTTVWTEYLEAKQEIHLKIMSALEKMGISIAFPSTSVYIEKWPETGLLEKGGKV
ncbi:MAG TPA: mechanosensitive ion channel family protein [Spirochaetia bacterium]|nr:MAG: hypothetical protein A2Y41_13655 [Spirochaetes bacterium GWB1_36_13]HCL57391.1 mechanosensitive ion channel family protein [Spirochaetia bacterium]